MDYVKLTPQDIVDNSNEHPSDIGLFALRNVFSGISYRKDSFFRLGDDKVLPVFNKKQVDILSRNVAKALKQAGPGEDVGFVVSGLQESFIGKDTLTTSGRLFIRGNKLNIIFSHINIDYKNLLDRRTVGEKIPKSDHISDNAYITSPIEPGSRRKKADLDVEIIQDEGIQLISNRDDWIQINIGTVARKQDLRDAVRARHEGKFSSDEDIPAYDDPEQPQSVAQPATNETRGIETPLTLEERLAKLKKLRDQGLIDEQSYKTKMEQILDEL